MQLSKKNWTEAKNLTIYSCFLNFKARGKIGRKKKKKKKIGHGSWFIEEFEMGGVES